LQDRIFPKLSKTIFTANGISVPARTVPDEHILMLKTGLHGDRLYGDTAMHPNTNDYGASKV
jgi:hypothetical protein